jgi:CPA1 family monovalent cation:H+ antiporter
LAGVLIGNHDSRDTMSDTAQRYVFGFWTLIDDILNAIPLVLAVRFISVAGPVLVLQHWQSFSRGT